MERAMVKKINKTEAILNNIIGLFYHKKVKKKGIFLAFSIL
ncbi:hypothetical protein HMPREF9182_1931 [Streptococcus sp. oral taxon 056 str. F0418]|nr:hypothetical protein HMPREF9182_1931 [Streptococcus sp. oral taxon 056 str. F0418]